MNPYFTWIQETTGLINKHYPSLLKFGYPRRIIPPLDYPNPANFAPCIAAQLLSIIEDHLADKSATDSGTKFSLNLAVQALVDKVVPTYFVSNALAAAAFATEVPQDMPISAIRWPMNAMLFVLPEKFIHERLRWYAPFLVVARAAKGNYPECLPNLPPGLKMVMRRIDNQIDRFCLWFPVFYPNAMPTDYVGHYGLEHQVKVIADAPMEDIIPAEAAFYGVPVERGQLENDPQAEKEFNAMMNLFAVKLLLALHSRPELIEHGEILRHPKMKKGKEREALWSPNMIGRTYRLVYKMDSEATGIQKRPHYRRGHFRHQRHGKGLTEVKVIWIEPMAINFNVENQPK